MISLTAAVAAGIAVGAPTASTHFDRFVDALNAADKVDVSYAVNTVGGASQSYRVALAKPNRAMISTPERQIVADGKTITVLMKKDNQFYEEEQKSGALGRMLSEDMALMVWLPFFDAKALSGLETKDAGTRNWRGSKHYVVNATTANEGDKITLYINSSDYLVRQAMFETKTMTGQQTEIMTAENVATSANDKLFAFTAPAGAKKIDRAAMNTGKWFHNWDEALAASKATGKTMMVDFYAVWCGPCKRMDAEAFKHPSFKNYGKDFILVKIDAEKPSQNVALAKKYKVSAYPTVKFIDSNERLVHEFVGYGGPQQVFSEMKKAASK